jgi:hypothetical protein
MSRIKQFGAVFAAAALLATSTFAEDRPHNQSGDWRRDGRHEQRDDRRDDRRNDRYNERRNLSAQGRITNLQRERDGYRVQLDRGNQWYYVPGSAWKSNRGRNVDVRIGVSIRLGGGYYDDRGYIHCDDAYIDDDYGYGRNDGYGRDGYGHRERYLTGYVQRVDYRRDVLELRDERSGRSITVDMRRVDRRSNRRGRGIDVNDLRRGDYIELSGQWLRGHVFEADSIDGLDSRRR